MIRDENEKQIYHALIPTSYTGKPDEEKPNARNSKHRESCCGCEYNMASLINGQGFHFCATQEGMTHYDPNFGKYDAKIPEWCPLI